MATTEKIKNALNNWAKMLENTEIVDKFEEYDNTMHLSLMIQI